MTLVEELRARANDMREEGIGGWADTCDAAAICIALLEAAIRKHRENVLGAVWCEGHQETHPEDAALWALLQGDKPHER